MGSRWPPTAGTVATVRAARLPVAERKQAPLVQAHAFDNYLLGACGGRFPISDARTDMRCPICLRWLPRSDFNLEHAPQRAHQSRLGPPWLLVSTCERCNSVDAGSTFESAAATVIEADRALGNDPVCRVHGTAHGDRRFDTGWMSSHEPVTLADLKSAYLIAFAVLGYSWATARRLDPLRAAFASDRPASPADALVTCGLVTPALCDTNAWCHKSGLPSSIRLSHFLAADAGSMSAGGTMTPRQ